MAVNYEAFFFLNVIKYKTTVVEVKHDEAISKRDSLAEAIKTVMVENLEKDFEAAEDKLEFIAGIVDGEQIERENVLDSVIDCFRAIHDIV